MTAHNFFKDYAADGVFDEVFSRKSDAKIKSSLIDRLKKFKLKTLERRKLAAERELYNLGITFTVYSDAGAIDRILPFDVLPRPIAASDWRTLERGCKQRVTALNAFLGDIYGAQKILKDGVVPRELVLGNKNYSEAMANLKVKNNAYAVVSGVDVIRDTNGDFLVLEDNCRCPSGVSYVIENRHLMMRAFPDLMAGIKLRAVSDYGTKLREKLSEAAPGAITQPEAVLLTPGVFNSAYFEHVFLAREMGVPLVEGRDLFVEDDKVFMRTVSGKQRVHVIYRRIDDDFLDPEVFRADSALGVPGLMRALVRGNVALANAIGAGIADDKALYAYTPEIIKYYLDEDPILSIVQTYAGRNPEELSYILENLEYLVLKPVGGSGGYGIVVGPKATKRELSEARSALKRNPKNFVAQPMVNLSASPTLTEDGVEPRHVDLRPFVLAGKDTWVLPGGLTRVALRKGSIVVNSSQGGGSKDTWVYA
ncbi:MAG: circularly permuted type 2 ATP-grasp protein [Pseudomonadota bacterium]